MPLGAIRGVMESGAEFVKTANHKTVGTYGLLGKFIPLGNLEAMRLYTELPGEMGHNLFLTPAGPAQDDDCSPVATAPPVLEGARARQDMCAWVLLRSPGCVGRQQTTNTARPPPTQVCRLESQRARQLACRPVGTMPSCSPATTAHCPPSPPASRLVK